MSSTTTDGEETVHGVTDGSVAASHPEQKPFELLAAPSTSSGLNTVKLSLIAVGCWKLEDIRFAFDSSFPTSGIVSEIRELQALRDKHKVISKVTGKTQYPPLSIFGHADPVGPATDPDGYNKALSGRRATIVYGILLIHIEPDRAVALWRGVSTTENWGPDHKQVMRAAVPPGTADADLLKTYMLQLCPPDFKLTPLDFLAQGSEPKGTGDYQGCSSFNPLVIFSQQAEDQYEDAKRKGDQAGIAARNASNAANRRVMVLLFRPGSRVEPSKWPCPNVSENQAGCLKRFWHDGEQRRHRREPDAERRFDVTHDTFACRFYHRLVFSSPCEKVFPRIPAVLEIILDSDDNHAVDAAEPAATFVRVGTWDHAFDSATGNLINQSADAQNFIGRESKGSMARRFYLRVRDDNAAGQPRLQVKWRTEFGGGGTDDAPASQLITLTPLTTDPKVFVSHALFLVTDLVDQAQATDSGLAATDPDKGSRNAGQSNHRTRLITVDGTHKLDSTIVAEYTSVMGGGTVKASVPVFERSPDERWKINVHLVNVLNAAGGTGALTAARKQSAQTTLRGIYAGCGIVLEIDEIVLDPPASCVNWATRYPASPLAIGADPAVEDSGFAAGNLFPSASQTDVIQLIRTRAGFDANDIYIVYINRIMGTPLPAPSATAILTSGPGGTSFPDSWTAAGSIARSFVFVGVQTTNQFADAHETTHVTTNLRNSAGGHFHLGATINTGPGNIDGRNLMQRFVLISNGAVADSKRLWDEDFTNNNITPSKIPAQITAIRASRFVRRP